MRLLTEEEIERMTEEEYREWQKKTTINNICQVLYRLDDKYLQTVEAFARSMYKIFVYMK